jgi:hypothetical protein
MVRPVVAFMLVALSSSALAGSTVAASSERTPVSIETITRGSTQGTSHGGAFTLVAGTTQKGTVSSTVDGFTSGKRNGQNYERIQATDTLKGNGWSLALRTRDSIGESAGSGYSVITGTWTVAKGTGKYAGARGGGRMVVVVLPAKGSTLTSHSRYEGVLTTP